MKETYNPQEIEKKWQKTWEETAMYKVADSVPGKENYYQLVEFSYPSGNLHVGHWYAFAVPDIHARFQRMQGKNVLYPMGFDAFGLPAENAAIKNGKNPREWTYQNIDYMREQLKSMGAMFDWDREVITCEPQYYQWTQWLFIQLFKAGLVEQKETLANWCPQDKTVLANEQVVNNACDRCGSPVEKKVMKQWQVAITKYADRLLADLDALSWPEEIKASQRNWIGKSEGAELDFEIRFHSDPKKNDWRDEEGKSAHIKVFTTRPDTLFGATYLVLAPEHPWVTAALEHSPAVLENAEEVVTYVKAAKAKTDIERLSEGKEKTGVELRGVTAINPGTNKEIPVYIADYVLASYGTGAIMAVPAHDQRDFEFAKKFELEILPVIENGFDGTSATSVSGALINSGDFSGHDSQEASLKIIEAVGGNKTSTYRLRDWGVSRQRYWGCPIPLVHCDSCGWQPVPDTELPVVLPEVNDYLPNDEGKSPLSKNKDFVNASCPKCQGPAIRETDTLDTFVDSSWYFLRYCDPKNAALFADKNVLKSWMPVNLYSGGAEHTTMHLLYSRFFHKALFDLGLVNESEPYIRRLNRSLILGPDGNKMSKSKGNVIAPDPIVEELGADTMRMYLAFIGPYNEVNGYPWNPEGVIGVHRFLERVWKLAKKVSTESNKESEKIESVLQKTLQAVEESVKSFKMNTGVAALMSCSNELKTFEKLSPSHMRLYAQLLAPYAPHIAEELWSEFQGEGSVHTAGWPQYDASKIVQEGIKMAVQVNGKVRAIIHVEPQTTEEEVQKLALSDEKVQAAISGKEIKKVIIIPEKIVSIVV